MKFFFSTDVPNAGKQGVTNDVIWNDGFIDVQLAPEFNIGMGRFLVPFSPENRASAATLLGMTFMALTGLSFAAAPGFFLGLFGVGSKDLGRFQLNAMAGEAFAFGQDEDIRDAFQYGTSLDYRLVEIKRRPLFLLSEILGGENPDRSREEWRATWFWGLLFEPTPRLAFDIGIGWGLEDVSPRWRTTLGATCTF